MYRIHQRKYFVSKDLVERDRQEVKVEKKKYSYFIFCNFGLFEKKTFLRPVDKQKIKLQRR